MVHENSPLPYTAAEYCQDLELWVLATEVPEERQGPLIVLALGGQARMVMEKVRKEEGTEVFIKGMFAHGRQYTGVEVICKKLLHAFLANDEATMLRSGLEFSSLLHAAASLLNKSL